MGSAISRLNYHRLYYFWIVAREGTVLRASERLNVSQPTISTQIRGLEESLGEQLFDRVGKRLVLTEGGRMAVQYAEEIFRLGAELEDSLRDQLQRSTERMAVGIADVVPKLIVHELVAPAYAALPHLRITFREEKIEKLLPQLAQHELDIVLTDAPVRPASSLRGFNHLLGQSDVAFFAAPRLARPLRRNFPASLDGQPMLLPAVATELRLSLDRWFESRDIHPRIVGEFDDSALMKVFGQHGIGVFPAHHAIRVRIERQFDVRMIAVAEGITDSFYAVTPERRVKHPAVAAMTAAARETFRAGVR